MLCKSCGDIRQNINIKLNLKNVANEQATIEQQLLLLFLIVITMYYGRGGLHKLKFHFWSTKKVNCATFPQNSFPQAQHGEWQSSVARSLSTLPFSPSLSHTLPLLSSVSVHILMPAQVHFYTLDCILRQFCCASLAPTNFRLLCGGQLCHYHDKQPIVVSLTPPRYAWHRCHPLCLCCC